MTNRPPATPSGPLAALLILLGAVFGAAIALLLSSTGREKLGSIGSGEIDAPAFLKRVAKSLYTARDRVLDAVDRR